MPTVSRQHTNIGAQTKATGRALPFRWHTHTITQTMSRPSGSKNQRASPSLLPLMEMGKSFASCVVTCKTTRSRPAFSWGSNWDAAANTAKTSTANTSHLRSGSILTEKIIAPAA